ncbi:MAG: NAD(P)/FAD-dependent oxidoreductase [Microcystaceae cyanobacterium]
MISDSQDRLPQPKTVLIIGGGISGLIAATVLQRAGIHVTILDKGRGIGGRLATRRIRNPAYGEGIFDYGAQFFTVSDPIFQAWIDEWQQNGVVKEWSRQFSEGGKPCYRGINSNRSIAQYLGNHLAIHTQTRAIQMTWNASHWRVQTENGANFPGEALILTSPIPQSLALLDDSEILLPSPLRYRLENVIYHPCIAVLALLEKPSRIPEPGGLRLKDASLAWVACNQKKGISQGNAVTLQATPEFSHAYWETDNAMAAEKLLEIASPWLGSSVMEYQVHRWRYSQPQTFLGEPYLALSEPGRLVMAGDAFSSPKTEDASLNVERAVLSGWQAAHYLLGG